MKHLFYIILFITVSVNSMASESEFWNWFSKNQEALESYEPGDEKLIDEILTQLHKYNENLYFEFSTDDEINEFIVSAEGNIEEFDSVIKLVGAAPKLNNWEIIAFKPAMGFDFITTYEGVDYDPDKIWFLPLFSNSSPERLGLRVGIPNYNSEVHEYAVSAMWVLLDTGLGELKAAQEIHHIETIELPDNPEDNGYIEIKEIDAYLIWRKKNM